MQPATKHYLFFAFLIVSLALLVALVLWQWHRARADGAERDAGRASRHDRRHRPCPFAATQSLRPSVTQSPAAGLPSPLAPPTAIV
jgi:hypothetical protein